ncbi:MAG: MHYT domain-containing protein [Pseudomonadota bacterium]
MLASIGIALMAGFTGMALTQNARDLPDTRRKLTLTMAAFVMGWGIWSMHFVAMLGMTLPTQIQFDALVTVASALLVILTTGLALLVDHYGPQSRRKTAIAGGILGVGILSMHYLGMWGMEMGRAVYVPLGTVVAAVVSIALAVGTFLAMQGPRSARTIMLGTGAFALTVCGTHYAAMAATRVVPLGDPSALGPWIGHDVLAFAVTLSAFFLSGLFLLTGASFAEAMTGRASPTLEQDVVPVNESPPMPAARLPYERNAQTHFIAANEVAAVRAEGRYTILYAGDEKLFCPWSISEFENRAGPKLFTRAHRSYLVNPDHVTGFEKKKDTGVCYFDGQGALSKVPVSRSRLPDVRERLGV